MANFADALKGEIARLARKELKSDVTLLRKTVAAHRGDLAALKREVKNLQAQVRGLAKAQQRASVSAASSAPQEQNEVGTRRGRKPVFSSELLKVMRQKNGLTQAQLASLLEVSGLSIYKWESGQSTPRVKQQEKIFALRKVGKRAIAKQLSELTGE